MSYIIYGIVITAIIFILATWKKEYTNKKNSREMYQVYREWATIAHEAKQKVQACKDLYQLLDLHKSLADKLQLDSNSVLGPCTYGYFRTKSIKTMNGSEVYLGDIFGLWTKTLDEWANCESTMSINTFGIDPNTKCKDLIFKQYYNILYKELSAIEQHSNAEANSIKYKYNF